VVTRDKLFGSPSFSARVRKSLALTELVGLTCDHD
jgi:hypothetical protein